MRVKEYLEMLHLCLNENPFLFLVVLMVLFRGIQLWNACETTLTEINISVSVLYC